MKRIMTIVIGIICISAVVGSYYVLSHKQADDTTEVTEVQKVILKDLSGKAYPATPREVIKFYNRIISCYYNEEYTEEEFKKLADQALMLMDKELADNNPAEQYYLRIQSEVESYREKDRTINNASVCDSNDVEFAEIDGAECASVESSYFVRDNDGFVKSSQQYILRKDTEGRWKILAFELAEGAVEENE